MKMRTNPFTLITDGSNDTGREKMNPLTVRVYDSYTSKVVHRFLDMCPTSGPSCGTAEVIYQKMDEALQKCHTMEKLILKEHGSIYIHGCPCHIIHNTAKEAGLGFLEVCVFDPEDLTVDVGYWFKGSTNRKGYLTEFCELHGSDSMSHWPATSSHQMRNNQGSGGCGSISNPMTEVYLLFYQATLPVFSTFNLLLQREKFSIFLLHDEIRSFIRKLLSKFLKPAALQHRELHEILYKDPSNQLPGEKLVIGFTTRATLNRPFDAGDITPQQVQRFQQAAVAFLVSFGLWTDHQSPSSSLVLQSSSSLALVLVLQSSSSLVLLQSPSSSPALQPSCNLALDSLQPPSSSLFLQPSSSLALILQPSSSLVLVLQPSSSLVLLPSSNLVLVLQPSRSLVLVLQPSSSLVLVLQLSRSLVLVLQPSSSLVLDLQPSRSLVLVLQPSSSLINSLQLLKTTLHPCQPLSALAGQRVSMPLYSPPESNSGSFSPTPEFPEPPSEAQGEAPPEHIKIDIETDCVKTLLGTIPPYNIQDFDFLLGEIRKDEVIQAVKELNVGKSPGPDGLPTEFPELLPYNGPDERDKLSEEFLDYQSMDIAMPEDPATFDIESFWGNMASMKNKVTGVAGYKNNMLWAITGAVVGAITGAVVGAITGAVVGAIPGAVVGAIPGAFGGAIPGAVVGAITGAVGAITGAVVVVAGATANVVGSSVQQFLK
ncbi:Methionine-rich protein [Dissostichus eleginoides]|uniref:Methionine-rich protein n=1 Tax=Dissostichus eleginoides TaxID=100907 RepID=A0AAD9CD54_DISEL|nr:Methionine-rich protein [Dissostichus eleginoides]